MSPGFEGCSEEGEGYKREEAPKGLTGLRGGGQSEFVSPIASFPGIDKTSVDALRDPGEGPVGWDFGSGGEIGLIRFEQEIGVR